MLISGARSLRRRTSSGPGSSQHLDSKASAAPEILRVRGERRESPETAVAPSTYFRQYPLTPNG